MRKRCIAVIGASIATPQELKMAYEVGKLIGKSGVTLITGGLGGVMEGASKGAKEAGGEVIGVIPTSSPKDANPYIDFVIVTGLGDARNVIIVSSADAIIAVAGGFGTLSEIAFALKRKKPVISLGTWKLDKTRMGDINVIEVKDPESAVREALKYAKRD